MVLEVWSGISHPLLEALTVLNTETWLVGFFFFYWGTWKTIALKRNTGLSMKVNPITRADFHRNVFLNWCSVYCFPVWVLLTCSELFWLLSFSQIKAKWFYLMFYFLCFDLIYMCMIHFMYWDLFPVLSIHLLLHSNLFSQNQAPWPYYWGFLFQLGTEDLKSHCLTKGGWPGSHRSNVICKEKNTFNLFFRNLFLSRFWACTILP